MELKKEIRILGRRIEVEPRAKESLKGITVGEKLSYSFYDGTYQGMSPCCSLNLRRESIPLHGLAPSRASG